MSLNLLRNKANILFQDYDNQMYSFKLVETKADKMRAVGQNDRIARYMSVCTSKRFRKDLGLVDIKDNVLLHYNIDNDEKRVIKGK